MNLITSWSPDAPLLSLPFDLNTAEAGDSAIDIEMQFRTFHRRKVDKTTTYSGHSVRWPVDAADGGAMNKNGLFVVIRGGGDYDYGG